MRMAFYKYDGGDKWLGNGCINVTRKKVAVPLIRGYGTMTARGADKSSVLFTRWRFRPGLVVYQINVFLPNSETDERVERIIYYKNFVETSPPMITEWFW